MKKSEIEFCERWLDLRGADGFAVWEPGKGHPFPGTDDIVRLYKYEPAHGRVNATLVSLTASGADLVASYEAALALGDKVKPDDEPEPAFKAGDRVRVRPEFRSKFFRDTPAQAGDVLTVRGANHGFWSIGPQSGDYARTEELQLVVYESCPDCEFGRVSIPGLMSVVPVDPDHEVVPTMTCPRCKGEKVVEADTLLDIGSSLEGLGEILDGQRAAPIGVIDDGWRQLTRVESLGLAGKPFYARQGLDDLVFRYTARSAQTRHGYLTLVGGGTMRLDGSWWVREARRGPP